MFKFNSLGNSSCKLSRFCIEDGHSFKVYLYYTFLSFPKIFSRLLLLFFFISIFYTILRYEEKNELVILWTNGIKKKNF